MFAVGAEGVKITYAASEAFERWEFLSLLGQTLGPCDSSSDCSSSDWTADPASTSAAEVASGLGIKHHQQAAGSA